MKFTHGLAVCLAAFALAFPAAAQDAAPVLSLHATIETALKTSPALESRAAQARAWNAASSKAGALPNPEVSMEAENIGGDGRYEGFESAEITYGVSQTVPLPGKRSGRSGVADSQERKSVYMRDAARLDLIRDVVIAYVAVVAAEENLKVLTEELDLAFNVHESVAAKVGAGKEPPIRKSKAGIELSSSDLALERARRSLQTARTALSIITGYGDTGFAVSSGTLPAMKEPGGIADYAAMLGSTPDVMAHDADIRAAQSNLSLEKNNMIPDPTVNVGVRDFREDDGQAFLAGVSFALPVFDANRAGVRRAGHEYNAALLDKAQARRSVESELAHSYESLANAYREHQVLKETVLPGAREAFDIAREGYSAGKFEYLEVLDAQRTLFQARKQSILTLQEYYRALAVIDRLTAAHAIQKKEQQ